MQWKEVGSWIKDNAGTGAALVGSLLTGNVPGAIAAGVSLVSGATGTDNPVKALESLQTNPETLLKLKELAFKEEDSIRQHIAEMKRLELEDEQKAHEQQQETIRTGDSSNDEYVRHTRPLMARRSYWAGTGYLFVMEIASAFSHGDGADIAVAAMLYSPAAAYMGFRTADKFAPGTTERALSAVKAIGSRLKK